MTVATPAVPLGLPSVLFTCTANICRSPMAEGLLRKHFARLSPGSPAMVSSAGQRAGGSAVAPLASAALASYGVDMSGHESRRLIPAYVVPAAWSKTFLLTEFCRRIAGISPRGERESFARYLARVNEGRNPADVLAAGTQDDIADPYGGPLSGFQKTAADLDRYTTQVACAILGVAAPLFVNEIQAQPAPRIRRGLFSRRSK
jgi:protein-tyrosine phosphatase